MRIKSERVWLAGVFRPAVVQMDGSVITGVLPHTEAADEDYGRARVVPGFIDVHTHGAFGATAVDAHHDKDGLRRWTAALPAEGVTAYLPSTYPVPPQQERAALAAIADVMEERPAGAEILGIHMEGPFCNPEYKGAMNPDLMPLPTPALLEEYQQIARGHVKYMTMACERDAGFATTRHARQLGIVITIGHSAATFEEAMMALANGAECFTHAFNAMRPLNHRQPGCAGAMMRSDAYCEAIFDGRHITYDILHLLFKTKGGHRVVGVSDSLAAKGMAPGEYPLEGEQSVIIDDTGTAIIKGTQTLAGSTLLFNHGLRRMVEEGGIPFDWALAAITANPARMLGLGHRLGHIQAGYDADVVVLADDYAVQATFCKGEKQA